MLTLGIVQTSLTSALAQSHLSFQRSAFHSIIFSFQRSAILIAKTSKNAKSTKICAPSGLG
jgi:hypothetical protein